MLWIAEWFDPGTKRVIEADSLDEADEQAYALKRKYPDVLYLEIDK